MMNKQFCGLIAMMIVCYIPAIVAAPHWNHEEQDEWGAIRDDNETVIPHMFPFATCGIGKHQSPVDLAAQGRQDWLNKLKINYGFDKPIFYNSGHGVQVNTSDHYQGNIILGDEIYPMIQFHFHEPSEHMIGDKQFPAELHFVHVRDDGKIAVLGVLIELGETHATFQSILDNIPSEEGVQNSHAGIRLNPSSLLPKNKRDHYSLAGSLTTPPCSEGVNWLVLSEPIAISAEQLEQLKSLYTNNARHVQDLNGRSVSHTMNH